MDIRSLYESLSPEDRTVYQKIRTDIRKVYLNAHTNIIGMDHWEAQDDAFLDLLDIKIAVIFDRAGAIEGIKSPINKNEMASIEGKIEDQGKTVGLKMATEMSAASIALKANGKAEGW